MPPQQGGSRLGAAPKGTKFSSIPAALAIIFMDTINPLGAQSRHRDLAGVRLREVHHFIPRLEPSLDTCRDEHRILNETRHGDEILRQGNRGEILNLRENVGRRVTEQGVAVRGLLDANSIPLRLPLPSA